MALEYWIVWLKYDEISSIPLSVNDNDLNSALYKSIDSPMQN